MRSNLGWQQALTRTLSVSAVLAWTTVAAWGQASTPSKPTTEPSPLGNVSHPTEPAPLSDQKTSDQKTNAGQTAAPNSQEANGIGPVLGAHFEHGTRGTRSELKVTAVDPNSPATRAGLQPNDRLIAIDGRSFGNPRQLIAYLSVLGGRPVPVVLERNGREMTVQLFPGQFQGDRAWLGVLLEENNKDQGPGQTFQNQNNQNQPGPNAATKSPNESPSQNTTAGASKNAAESGAEVSQVYPNGPAARAGLRTGDVIIQVNGQKVDDPAELVALVHEMKPQSQAELEVLRDNKQIKVPVTLGSRNQEYMAQFGPGQFGQGGQYGQGQFGPGQGGPPQVGGQYGPGQGAPWQGNGPGQFPQGPAPWQGQAGSNSNEFQQQLRQQNQRIEDELKQLREEIKQLREQLQKK
jgi:PDZ domain-containing secreted protein